jgi:protein-tyrosine-phosphatase
MKAKLQGMNIKILFVCVHNSGRSQMAEAFFNRVGNSVGKAQSAGTQPAEHVDDNVILVMQEAGIDISRQLPKLLTPRLLEWADRVITMGCGVEQACPVTFIETEDWAIEDPKDKSIEKIREIRDEIQERVMRLLKEIIDAGN